MSRREALAALARRYPDDYQRIYQSIKAGAPIDEVTVAEWAPQWLQLRARSVRPGTYAADGRTGAIHAGKRTASGHVQALADTINREVSHV